MFGINDSNQKTASQGPAEPPAPLPPSPFMDNSTPGKEPPQEDTSAPALPDIPPITDNNDAPAPAPTSPGQDDLMGIKTQALSSLAPLVGHLDQTPEEKFKTTMMLIQASDNSQLVKEAYEIANQIPDEKAKAQALLDVVNEINYFTQKSGDKKA